MQVDAIKDRQHRPGESFAAALAGAARILGALVAFCIMPGPASAEGAQLLPQTKLRLTVVQWMPLTGRYEPWSMLGGEFTVTDEKTVVLPLLGPVAVGAMDSAALGQEIAKRLQEKTRLVDRPDATVEVLRFPPVYVIGDVAKPGQYDFRPGMTVLQALALGGGELRSVEGEAGGQTQLAGKLEGLDHDILRRMARIARLQAEMSGAASVAFPALPKDPERRAIAAKVEANETVIFTARLEELDRQTKRLADLRGLFEAEIDVLQQKIKAEDAGIESAERELTNVKQLVEKGIATASRQSELERALSNYRANRLDEVTAVMRARQGLTEAGRNLDGLRDQKHTDAAAALQDEEAALEKAKLEREVSQRLLIDLIASGNPRAGAAEAIAYALVRRENGVVVTIPAAETAELQPGDVLKVSFAHRAGAPADLLGSDEESPPAFDTAFDDPN